MKLRISRELHERAKGCADAVGEPLTRWCWLAVRAAGRGKFAGVADDEILVDATRDGSTVVTVHECGTIDADGYRRGIAAAVLFCEARNPRPVATGLVEGRDYLVAKGEKF